MDPVSLPIDRIIVDAILAGRIRAGTRLGEQALATLFGVSRTSVREALIRLETRGIVQVSPRRGWFVIEPSLEEAQEAFQARRAIEMGILRTIETVEPTVIAKLKDHIAREREAIASNDAGARSYLLGDFHVCLVEAFGNRILADILRDLTARTVLISALYQSDHDATESCDEHEHITEVLASGDLKRAAELMIDHIGNVEAGLTKRIDTDPLLDLRHALQLTIQKSGPTDPPRKP
ncbi:GntR family transcriptional regulator [Bosea sp. PAMC 26642]|uniref:GntR family transcriptional regulator n=1 Tax=Bosea sp. (strain PAMC 26642) TaxID=1792307 RepID=UPI000770607B|nr:GntR family transcriptional regulator [Bosea sp. PAMC 26642]AMJ63365.1 GntR family transcriptional regulator [Bosea sp. PAMC 26642]